MGNDRSLKKNVIYNLVRNISLMVFPLVTFPYINRILGVDNVGRYNFANSIVQYFLLFAGLGVSGYSIREGAKLRDRPEKSDWFMSEMFSINMIAAILAYIAMLLLVIFWKEANHYKGLICILGVMIVASPFSVTWLFTIYEDFLYITRRTILFQILSIVLLFVFVKDKNDVNLYAVVSVISNVGSNIYNYICGKKYCRLHFTYKIDWKKHMPPIMIIFITSLSIAIYVNSDITILGMMHSDHHVGLYSISVKVYNLLKNALISILTVVQARSAFYIGTGQDGELGQLSALVINLIIFLSFPIMAGVIALHKEIILILANEDFLEAGSSLCILITATAFNVFGVFFNTCILMPYKKERAIFYLSIIGALTNVALNFILIPLFAENAAALTTVVSEFLIFAVESKLAYKYIDLNKSMIRNLLASLIGSIMILVVSFIVHDFVSDLIINVMIIFLCGSIIYLFIHLALDIKLSGVINKWCDEILKRTCR